jgi:hypothetical protein
VSASAIDAAPLPGEGPMFEPAHSISNQILVNQIVYFHALYVAATQM